MASPTTLKSPLTEGGNNNRGRALFGTNPVIRKMSSRAADFPVENRIATYDGIAVKTLYFLVIAVLGAFLCSVLHDYFISTANPSDIIAVVDDNGIFNAELVPVEAVIMLFAALVSLLAPLAAWLIRPAIPVIGTLYAVCEGYFIGVITVMLAPEYEWASLLAFVLTVALVAIMLFLYARGIVKVTGKMRTVIIAVFAASIIGSIAMFLLTLIPLTRPMVMSLLTFMDTPVVSILLGVIYLVVACLMLFIDFDVITNCVEGRMSKKLEWMAAWGLAYTIIYIYLKILQIILEVLGNSKSKK